MVGVYVRKKGNQITVGDCKNLKGYCWVVIGLPRNLPSFFIGGSAYQRSYRLRLQNFFVPNRLNVHHKSEHPDLTIFTDRRSTADR
jgi:hypothetical protein